MRVRFFAAAGDTAASTTHPSDWEEHPDDITEDQLNELAVEHMWGTVSPDCWFEIEPSDNETNQ